jgi:hypothetical protein
MWFIQNYRPSNSYIIVFSILLVISIYMTLYEHRFSKSFRIKSRQKLPNKNSSSSLYLRVRLDLTTNLARCQSNANVIIYILSTITNTQRRATIRSTWGSPLNKTCFVFILGKSLDSPSHSIQSRIDQEKRRYQDIIQINHHESYANLIYKEIAALQWSYHMYPTIPYLYKTNDDLLIDSILISTIAQILVTNSANEDTYISKHRPRLISNLLQSDRSTFFRGGWSMDSQRTLRHAGKFSVNESVWPHTFLPLYCSGFGWFMSGNVRNRLLDASYTYLADKTVWIGDVFLSGFLAKAADVKCTEIAIDFEQSFPANCSCLMAQRPMLTVCSSSFHGGNEVNEIDSYREYIKAWRVIRQRHSLISQNTTDC